MILLVRIRPRRCVNAGCFLNCLFIFLQRTTDPVAIEMYNTKIVTSTKKNFYSAKLGMALVKKGGFAFHVDDAAAYRQASQ